MLAAVTSEFNEFKIINLELDSCVQLYFYFFAINSLMAGDDV